SGREGSLTLSNFNNLFQSGISNPCSFKVKPYPSKLAIIEKICMTLESDLSTRLISSRKPSRYSIFQPVLSFSCMIDEPIRYATATRILPLSGDVLHPVPHRTLSLSKISLAMLAHNGLAVQDGMPK